MRDFVQTFTADEKILAEYYNQPLSTTRSERFRRFYLDSRESLQRIDFDALDGTGQVDYILFDNLLKNRLKQLELDSVEREAVLPLVPFAERIIELAEARQRVEEMDPEQAAAALFEITSQVPKDPQAERTLANLAAKRTDETLSSLTEWFEFYTGYDPLFSWWCETPFQAAKKALTDYAQHLREKLVGIPAGDDLAIVGKPIGREALLAALEAEMIPYTPEELIELGKREYAWGEAEMKRAAQEMGCGDDWHLALERTKQDHLKPGEQPRFIRELTEEAIQFVKDHNLMTIPPLAEEVWRMQMMSPDRQKVNPFFLGGDTIIVSFPTDSMTQEEKLKSMRANNRHFARATVFHELIPGHHLQAYIEERNYPYRSIFYTPFWTEGWALWMEFLFWELGFPQTPENRVGMLFWRMHRCVRIEFSLGFHLGWFTPEECIEMLVEKVGHERGTAEGEVRRSFKGDYPALYQAAYMLGAMQMRSLARECLDNSLWPAAERNLGPAAEELVSSKQVSVSETGDLGSSEGNLVSDIENLRLNSEPLGPDNSSLAPEKSHMTYLEFHNAILAENNIPIPVLRAILTGQRLTRDFRPEWKFEG